MEKTFSILTIGCKLNQFESEWIREALLRRDWTFRRFEEGARFCIINSCTVTGKSDARCRNAVRRMRRISPASFIVVTGCYAETQPEELSSMDEVDLVLGNRDKHAIPGILDEMAARDGCRVPIARAGAPGLVSDKAEIDHFFDHSRAFIKIQEGCNASCSYCIVPRARGRSRSVAPDAVLRQVRILQENGYREIVLTGIHIGRYGADLDPPQSLTALVEQILDRTNGLRVRLSSIELTEVTPRLVELVTEGGRLAPHVHIPLQSGDDAILEAMNRPYRVRQFRDTIETLAREKDDLAIGTDIIVGFPGETEERFKNTLEVVRDLPISYFHVFSFSPRPGTRAASLAGQVSPEAKKSRSGKLIELGASKKRSFLKSQIGTTQLVLVEGPVPRTSSFARSLTGNYCEVFVRCRENVPAGALAHVRVTHYSMGNLYGTLLGEKAARAARPGDGAT